MIIKNNKAVSELQADISELDVLINEDKARSLRNEYPEISGLVQVLRDDFDRAIDVTESANKNKAIHLAERALKEPSNVMAVSELIAFLEKSNLNINSGDLSNLKSSKSYPSRVTEYTSSILASLK